MKGRKSARFAAVLLLLCAWIPSAQPGEKLPRWVNHLPRDPFHLYAVGTSTESWNAAEEDARGELARSIEVEVSAEIESFAGEVKEGNKTYLQDIFVSQTHSVAKRSLKWTSLVERFYDKKTGTFYVLARVAREDVKRMLQEEIDRTTRQTGYHLRQARAFVRDGQISKGLREAVLALRAFKLLAGRSVEADVDGDGTPEPVELTVTAYLQSLLDRLALRPVKTPRVVKVGRAVNDTVAVALAYDRKLPVSNVPVCFRLLRGQGECTQYTLTDSRGVATAVISRMEKPEPDNVLRAWVPLAELFGEDSTLVQVYSLSGPALTVHFTSVAPGMALVVVPNSDATAAAPVLYSRFAELLSGLGYQVLDLMRRKPGLSADLATTSVDALARRLVEEGLPGATTELCAVSYRFRDYPQASVGGQALPLRFADLDITVRLYDLSQVQLVAEKTWTVKGGGLSLEQARETALRDLIQEVKADLAAFFAGATGH